MKDMKKKKKEGFTLIELIVVIAILGILAAIAIPRVSGYIETSKEASDKETAAIVCNAAATYYAQNPDKAVPTDTAAWETALENAGLINSGDFVLKSSKFTTIAIAAGSNTGEFTVTLTGSGIPDYEITK